MKHGESGNPGIARLCPRHYPIQVLHIVAIDNAENLGACEAKPWASTWYVVQTGMQDLID